MYVRVNVAAGSRKEKCVRESDTEFSITVREPAERNMANKRVRTLLALHYHIEEENVRLISGHHSPRKIFDITTE